jgi:hypothetical protein
VTIIGLYDIGKSHDPGSQQEPQRKHTPQEPGTGPGRGTSLCLRPIYPLLARCRNDRAPKLTMRRQTSRIPPQMDARQGSDRCQLLQAFQRRERKAGRWCRQTTAWCMCTRGPHGHLLQDTLAPRRLVPCIAASTPTDHAKALAPGCWRTAKTSSLPASR